MKVTYSMISEAPDPPRPSTTNSRATPCYLTNIATSACLDWLSLTGPESSFTATKLVIERHFGPLKSTGHAVDKYADRHHSADHPGLSLLECHQTNSAWKFELKGEPLGILGHEPTIDLILSLPQESLSCTRIDCTIDLKHEDCPQLRTLIEDFEDDCAARLVEPHRRHRHIPDRDGDNLVGDSLYHGSKKEPRCMLLIYDKGLESTQGKSPPGEWIRWEAKFRADKAAAVFRSLMEEPTPERVAALSRGIVTRVRGKAAWVLDVLSTTSISPPPERPTSNLTTRVRNFQRGQAPWIFAVAEGTGLSPLEVVENLGLFEKVSVSDQVKSHPAVREACKYLSEHVISQRYHAEIDPTTPDLSTNP